MVNEYNKCVKKASTAYAELRTDICNSLSGEKNDLNSLLRNYSNFIRALENWDSTYRKLAEHGCLPKVIYENNDLTRSDISDMIFNSYMLTEHMVSWYISEDDSQDVAKTQIYTTIDDFGEKIEILNVELQPSLVHALKFYFG
ncbi:MAG: hypothetical protein E7299_03430 [Lachnospiraceae bacterium]|nr:hypothetical protein [Lachnospiraceae bacterium]